MWMRMVSFAVLVACVGCSNTRRAPTVAVPSATPAAAPAPKRDMLQEAGDATWRVVTAPARIITPPKKADPKEPVTYEAPLVTFTRRSYVDEETAVEAGSQPATRP